MPALCVASQTFAYAPPRASVRRAAFAPRGVFQRHAARARSFRRLCYLRHAHAAMRVTICRHKALAAAATARQFEIHASARYGAPLVYAFAAAQHACRRDVYAPVPLWRVCHARFSLQRAAIRSATYAMSSYFAMLRSPLAIRVPRATRAARLFCCAMLPCLRRCHERHAQRLHGVVAIMVPARARRARYARRCYARCCHMLR